MEKTSRRCRDFAAGKCSRGSQCRFLHQGYFNSSRHRDHPRNELTERSNFKADDRGTIKFCDYKGSASGPCYKISDNRKDYCEEVESRKDAVCWKKSLEGKFFREDSCRYSHHRSSGEEYDRQNERIAYDQTVRPLVMQNDIGHCKFFSIGRCHQNDCRFSHDVGRVTTGFLDAAKTKKCDDVCSLDRPKAKLSGREEDEIKSEKCSAWDKFASMSEKPDTTGWGKWPDKPNSSSHDSLGGEKTKLNQKSFQHGTKLPGREEDEIKSKKCSTWDKYAGVSEKPKDNTGWDKWPGKPDNYIWNSTSHDSQNGRSKGNIYSQNLSEVKMQIDDNILRNSVKKSGKRNDSGSNEKLFKRDKLMDLNKPVDREKARGQGKDKTESWNGPTWDEDWSLDRPKAKLSVWGENVKKSENGSTWDKYASVSGRPKDTTSWENWPAWPDSSNANSNSHDSQNKTWDCRSRGSIYPQDLIDGNIAYNFVQKDMTKSLNGPTWGDGGCSLDRQKTSGRSGRANGNKDPHVFADVEKSNDIIMAHSSVQDISKSWNGPTWGGEGCSLDRPKATRKGDRATGNRDPRIRVYVEERNDGNISHSFVQKGIQNSSSEWNKKVTVRDANRLSPLQNDYNGAGSNTNEVSDAVKLNDGKKSPNQGEDKKNSWNPNCDDSACLLDNTKASGWGGSKSSNDRHCHDPVDEEKPSQNNLVNMAISGQDNKVVGKDEYRPTHMLNGREGVDKDTGNLLASKKMSYSKENQIEAQGSEPGGFIFPPSSLMGLSQSSHALSSNPLNGCNIILDKSVKYKLSALVNQMQNQFDEALKILEMWACQNSITADQALRLSKLQAYLSESGVHVKSNEVLEKLKMEYPESSTTILKQQEPVGYTEPNQKTVLLEKVSGNNSKGEQCKKEEEIIQSVGADERCEAGESRQDEKSMWLFKNALVKLVKEILNPIWKEGKMKKEVHNTIVKKVVDKVISTEGVNITSIQEHIEQYLSFSKPQISALINVSNFLLVLDIF